MARPTVSIIIPTLNEGENLLDTVEFALCNSGDDLLELIVVDDGCTDGSPAALRERFSDAPVSLLQSRGIGVPGARNAGAAVARGEVLVFLDSHCFVPEGWLDPLLEALHSDPAAALVGPAYADIREPRLVGCGMTWRDPSLEPAWLPRGDRLTDVPFHGGAGHVVRADRFREVGGYDAGMTRWGSEDQELCLRLWLRGYTVLAEPRSVLFHLFRDRHPYPVEMLDMTYNRLRMALLHFDESRLARVIRAMLPLQGIEQVLARAMMDGCWQARAACQQQQRRDVGWLFRRFDIPI